MKQTGSPEANPQILSLPAYESITVQRIWERIIFLNKCAVDAMLHFGAEYFKISITV